MHRIEFTEFGDGMSQLGGGAWFNSKDYWPICPISKKYLLPVMTIRGNFFPTERFPSPDLCITVFISVIYNKGSFYGINSRHFAASDTKELSSIKKGTSRVILHDVGDKEIFMDVDFPYINKCGMHLVEFTSEEKDEEVQEPDDSLYLSKFSAFPSWLQDPVIPPPSFSFNLQLLEYDIVKISPEHEGIFNDGAGYLFLSRNLRRMKNMDEAGFFIVQYT